ncbi:MAG: hypothetical protein WA666_09060 [Nitrospirota bacterium]
MKDMNKAFKPIYDGIENVLDKLTGSSLFYTEMLKEDDDWSFVIKNHALIESALTYLLVNTLKQPQLQKIFSMINISDDRTGKIAFIKSLGLLPKNHITFIHALSTLRNQLVHDIHNVNFSFKEYFQELETKNKQGLKSNLKKLGCIMQDLIPIYDRKISKEQYIRQNIRLVILQGSVSIIARIYLHEIGHIIDDSASNTKNPPKKKGGLK